VGILPTASLSVFVIYLMEMLQGFFFISVNFCFSFVSNSLAYITIPKNKTKPNKPKLTEMKKK